jgi:concanavalin A-like lectin/glucanase superfamily protein
LTNNTWTHLCAVFVPNTLTLYVNGVQQSTVSTDAFIPRPSSNVLGARTTTTGNLLGKLDEVKIWNRALTAAEVLDELHRCGN